jgi:hypothetical protein
MDPLVPHILHAAVMGASISNTNIGVRVVYPDGVEAEFRHDSPADVLYDAERLAQEITEV